MRKARLMPRQPRWEYPGALYHVMSRGDQRYDKLGEKHPGQATQETVEAKADRLAQEHLRLLGWTESDLATRRSRDPSKLAIAARQRAEPTPLMKRTAERLHLGKPKGAKTNLHKRVNGVRENDPQPTLGI